jgi:ferredoxin--NADP+ reductase
VDRLTRLDPEARIDILDRLPSPFGLVRYGVAPDHQGTKAIVRVLERALHKPGVSFHGNVEVGRDVTIEELRACYDAVLLAVGVGGGRRLGISGEELPQVVGSWEFVSWINGRPGHDMPPADLSQVRSAVVVGLGNVAIDVARTLLKRGAWDGSDLGAEVTAALAAAPIERVTIVGRGTIEEARFGHGELRELVSLPGLAVKVDPPAEYASNAIAQLLRDASGDGDKQLHFRFGAEPIAVLGKERAEALRIRTRVGEESLPADLIVTCIGYICAPLSGLVQTSGRFVHHDNRIATDLFVGGWAATGPRGTIASSRAAAHAVAERIHSETIASGKSGLDPTRLRDAIDLAGWRRLDAAERAGARRSRVRAKFTTIEAMLRVARGGDHQNGEQAA